MKEYNITIIGATGSTGMETLQILEERKIPTAEITLCASANSQGKELSFRNKNIKLVPITEIDFSKQDIAIFCAGTAVSRKYAKEAAKAGCVIIDKTSCFRLDPTVPLVVPEVNGNILEKGSKSGIISTPNCVAVPLSMALKALLKTFKLKRVVVSTYQAVSGAGRKAMDALTNEIKNSFSVNNEPLSGIFPKPIAYNVIPAIGDILSDGFCEEEDKIRSEILKILKSDVKVAITCVRVPTFIGHCMSVACEFNAEISEQNALETLANFEGITVIDRRNTDKAFITPIECQGEDSVFISRIRKDVTIKNGLMFWIACDNLRKGAALNSVQIIERMIEIDPKLRKFRFKM